MREFVMTAIAAVFWFWVAVALAGLVIVNTAREGDYILDNGATIYLTTEDRTGRF